MLKQAKKVTISVVYQDLREALDRVFKDHPLTYEIVDKTIAVKLKEPAPHDVIESPPAVTVTGRITYEIDYPFAVVSIQVIVVKGVALSAPDGSFTLAGVREDSVLVFS